MGPKSLRGSAETSPSHNCKREVPLFNNFLLGYSVLWVPDFPRQLHRKDVGCLDESMMSERFCSILVIAIAALLVSPAGWAQATGSFSGTVTDKSGSPVSGATVTVTSPARGAVRETTTDEPGHYTVNQTPTRTHCLQAFTC